MRSWIDENKQKIYSESVKKKIGKLWRKEHKFHKILQKMNNEHYDEIGRTEDFSMISTMEDGN